MTFLTEWIHWDWGKEVDEILNSERAKGETPFSSRGTRFYSKSLSCHMLGRGQETWPECTLISEGRELKSGTFYLHFNSDRVIQIFLFLSKTVSKTFAGFQAKLSLITDWKSRISAPGNLWKVMNEMRVQNCSWENVELELQFLLPLLVSHCATDLPFETAQEWGQSKEVWGKDASLRIWVVYASHND